MIKVSSLNHMNKIALAFSASNIGPKRFQNILNHFSGLEKAWDAKAHEYEKIGIFSKTYSNFDNFRNTFDTEKYALQLKKNNIDFISFLDGPYPKMLKKLENPPIGIFVKGNINLLKEKFSVGVVGTRKMTSYGRSVTEGIVSELVDSGVVIISGLALGVDGTAHRAAVSNNGKTIAILACGVDCCRPSENLGLYQDIIKNGGLVISEYPLSMQPQKGTFLARNRIIAALSDGVLVTEAAEDSGSLVTAEWGFKLSKKVFAVPGPITSKMSDGSLKLLKRGAILVTEGKDVLNQFNIKKTKGKVNSQKFKNLSNEEKKIVSLLENEELTIDALSKKINLPSSKLFISVSNLELLGIIKNNGGKISLTNNQMSP